MSESFRGAFHDRPDNSTGFVEQPCFMEMRLGFPAWSIKTSAVVADGTCRSAKILDIMALEFGHAG